MVSPMIVLCLSLTMYEEARNQPIQTQLYVGEVVLNRAEKREYLDGDICKVVLEKKQFSWTSIKHLKTKQDLVKHYKNIQKDMQPKDREALLKAVGLSVRLLVSGTTSNFEYFYDGRVPHYARGKAKHKVGDLYFLNGER